MSGDAKTSLIQRLRHTPLRDLLRGNVSGRCDVNGRIGEAKLPASAEQLIRRVVRRTGLWKSEKMAVAEELIAHFLDGLEAGRPVEELVGSFGDEKKTAKLIRRAKIRNRLLMWHAMKWTGRFVGAMILAYVAAGVYFFAGHASPSVDYIAEMNQRIEGVPMSDRGWPLYAPLLRKLDAMDDGPRAAWPRMVDAVPGSRDWPEMEQWLRDNAGDVENIRLAAAKPFMGFVLGEQGSDHELVVRNLTLRPTIEQPLVSVLLPHLNSIRTMAQVMEADLRQARLAGDGPRVRRDLETLLNIPRQLKTDPAQVLICDLVGLGIRGIALQQFDETLATTPGLLTDQDLTQLAHQFSQVRSAADLISFKGERANFYDLMQRMYTDDGHGNGRLAPQALTAMMAYQNELIHTGGQPIGPSMVAVGPAIMLFSASRQELRTLYDDVMNQADAQLAYPMRDGAWDPFERRIALMRASKVDLVRYGPVTVLAPALGRTQVSAERALGKQEGVMIGIALELHRRKTGAYPATLADLSPQLLPTVPVDRITGEPLKYKLVDGKPLVYSVGANRVDDGGKPIRDAEGRVYPFQSAEWGATIPPRAMTGDWVLYPVTVDQPTASDGAAE